MSSLHITLQTTAWRLDLASLALGLILGILLAFGFSRALPYLRQLREQSVSRVQETQAWVRAGVEQRFQVETAEYVADYHLGRPWATLEEVFVKPRPLVPPTAPTPDDLEDPVTAQLTRLWPETAAGVGVPPMPTASMRRLLLNGRRVILSAPAGMGKTTVLATCAHLCATASDTGPYTFLLPVMPVFVHLAELDLTSEAANENPAAALAEALQKRAGPLTAPGVARLLEEKLASDNVLLLLDGWDELSGEQQAAPAAWLGRLLAQHEGIHVIAAARPRGYERLLDLGFVLSGLEAWRPGQAEEVAARWAEVFGWSQPPHLEQYWRPGQSPFVTSHMLWRLQNGAERPVETLSSQSDLMEAALQERLPEQEVKKAAPRPDEEASPSEATPWLGEAARRLWQELAFRLLREEKLSLAPQEVNEAIEETLTALNRETRHAATLRKTLLPSGLFVQWGDKSISFLSPLWRDYLAAALLAADEKQQTVIDHLNDGRWRKAIRFYAARTGGSQIAEWLLDPGTVDPFREGLFQVVSWLPETQGGGEWRRQALVQLGQLIVRPNVPQPIRLRAVAAIAQSGEQGVMTLVKQLLQRADPEMRQAAVAALACFDGEETSPLFERMLKDDNVKVRVAAVHALGWQNHPVGEKPLLMALIGRDEKMSRAAAEELALKGGEGWEILQEAAVDEEVHVRRTATHGLMMLDAYWAVALLEKMEVEDDEWAVQSAARVAAEAIAARNREDPWEPEEAADLRWLIQWATKRQESVPAGTRAIETLCQVVRGAPEPEVRLAAAGSLATVQLTPAYRSTVKEALREAFQNEGKDAVRGGVFAALAQFHRAEAT